MSYPEPTVSAVIFNPENKILLCRSHKWDDKFVIPGGHIETGESMEEALRREIKEETGLEIRNIELVSLKECIHSDSFHEKRHFIFIDYTCRTDSSEVTLNEEAQEYRWVDLEKIDELPMGGFTESLLKRLQDRDGADGRVEIFYNY